MKNLENLKEDLNYELAFNASTEVDEIIDQDHNNLYTLVMTSPWITLDTLECIAEYTGDDNPVVYNHHGEKHDSRLEVVVEWLNEDTLNGY